MKQTITFNLDPEDKLKLIQLSKKERLSLSTFCRYHLLQLLSKKEGGISKND